MKFCFLNSLIFLALASFVSSCSSKTGKQWFGSLGLGDDRIYISGPNSTLTAYAVTVYDTDGNLLSILHDYGENIEYPRGLAYLDPFTLIVSVDGTDRLDTIDIFGNVAVFASSTYLSGNLYDVERDSSGNLYVAESNYIERMSPSGERYPLTGNAYINNVVGGCTLSTVHGLTINSSGQLVAVNSGGSDNLNVYDISGDTSTCVNSVAFGNDPYDVVAHPNGFLYVVTYGDDSIYQVNEDGTGASIIYTYGVTSANPSAIAVMPDGNLLVANTGIDAIDLFASDGTLIKSPFIKNTFTANVSDLLVVEGQ